jgi:Tol biopolymer transport system component
VLAQGAQRRVGNVGVQVWLPGDRFVGITTGVRSWQAPRDIMTFGLGDTVPRPLIATPADDRDPWPSPDGRWLAYASSVTGTLEVYVRPFTAPGPSVRVSTGGGLEPRWSRSGAELFYRSGASIVVARVAATGADFRVAGAPETLFTGTYDFTQDNNWDVAPDGRFLMVRGDPTSGTHLHAVFNWFDEVRALAPR